MKPCEARSRWFSYQKVLVLMFVLTLPLVNPWVHSDGVGYYAYLHSLLIDHDLRFENEWLTANPAFLTNALDEQGNLKPHIYTSTGYIGNYFSVGPSLLWAPPLYLVHAGVLAADRLGAGIPADGYSKPYLLAMAAASACYAFCGLLLAFQMARAFWDEKWAFLATVGIWLASSLPVYMYFNPSYSHAHSAFAVSLFLWHWNRTRAHRTLLQWLLLGAIAGLMLDVYYLNVVFLLVPLAESAQHIARAGRARERLAPLLKHLSVAGLVTGLATLVAFSPTLITRKIIYGNWLELGYGRPQEWAWRSPVLAKVLFSSNHGLLSWTPILIPALLGLGVLYRRDRDLARYSLLVFAAFLYVIASFPTWHGTSSFGNRFFISLTPIFVLGLAGAFEGWSSLFKSPRMALASAVCGTAVLVLWNLGFIFQWGTGLIPNRGPISWRSMAYNQAVVVPTKALAAARMYFWSRTAFMQKLDQENYQEITSGGRGKKQQ